MKKKSIIVLIISIVAGIIFIAGFSYAYIRLTSTQENTNNLSTLNCLNISVTDNSATVINLEDAFPIPNDEGMELSPYQITLSNTCSNTIIKVGVYLEDNNSTLNFNYLRASLNDRDNTEDLSKIVGTQESITTSNSKIGYKLNMIYLDKNETKDLDFRVWIDEAATSSQAGNKTFSGKIYVEAEPTNMVPPSKGDLIVMNVGNNLPTKYRVLKLDGSEALVLAMQDYNPGIKYDFDADIHNQTIGDDLAAKYAGSDLDILLNTTIYGKMSSIAKNAIISKNIVQNQYYWEGWRTVPLQTVPPFDHDYQYQYDWNNNDWTGLSLHDTVTIGERFVYALDLEDIFNYLEKRYATSNDINMMFYNHSTSWTSDWHDTSDSIWLRSPAGGDSGPGPWGVNGSTGSLKDSVDDGAGVRATFVIDLSKIDWEYDMPNKGTLITMDVGDGLPDTYRVLKTNKTEALVLAMRDYNVGTTYQYNQTDLTTTFGSYTGQQYAGSDLDMLLNTTMYGEMNSTAKSAIVAKNINQNMFYYSDQPNELEESEPYTYEYQYQFNWNNNDWENIDLFDTVNVGSRYVYALDVADIYEYIGKRYISSSELNEMFFNQNTAYTTNSTMGNAYILLRSASSLGSSYVWYVNGGIGAIRPYANLTVSGARAAFVIDLSKIEYEEV